MSWFYLQTECCKWSRWNSRDATSCPEQWWCDPWCSANKTSDLNKGGKKQTKRFHLVAFRTSRTKESSVTFLAMRLTLKSNKWAQEKKNTPIKFSPHTRKTADNQDFADSLHSKSVPDATIDPFLQKRIWKTLKTQTQLSHHRLQHFSVHSLIAASTKSCPKPCQSIRNNTKHQRK